MNYIVDINKGRVKKAIAALGINIDLLVFKKREDFYENDITDDVIQLRFDYYQRKQQELARMIKDRVDKDCPVPRINSSNKPSTFLTQVQTNPECSTNQTSPEKNRHKRKLLKSLKEIEKKILDAIEIDRKIEQSRESKQRAMSLKSARKNTFEGFRLKQAENLKQLQKEENIKRKKFMTLEIKTPKLYRKASEDESLDISVRVSTANDSFEEHIEDKLKKHEEKMRKSQLIHDQHLKKKQEAALKLLEKVPRRLQDNSLDNSDDIALRFISKQEASKERRENLLAYTNEKRLKIKSQFEKRINSVKHNMIFQQNQTVKNSKLQVKMAKSEIVLQKKQEDWTKKLEIKNEIHRLREENIVNESERINSMM